MSLTIPQLVEAIDKWSDELFDAIAHQLTGQYGDEEFPTGTVTLEVEFQIIDSVHHVMQKSAKAIEELDAQNQDLRDQVRTLLSILQARGAFNVET